MRVVIVVGVASQPLSTYDALFFRKSNPRVRWCNPHRLVW